MEPHAQAPWYLHEIPAYASGRYSPSVCKRHGFGGLSASHATSAVALTRIHPPVSLWSSAKVDKKGIFL
jgi:hypothetical protein